MALTDEEYQALEGHVFDEADYRDMRRALTRACNLFDQMRRAFVDDDFDSLADLLDGEVYDFLRSCHPDYGAEE